LGDDPTVSPIFARVFVVPVSIVIDSILGPLRVRCGFAVISTTNRTLFSIPFSALNRLNCTARGLVRPRDGRCREAGQ
jgi:hypothetical protein